MSNNEYKDSLMRMSDNDFAEYKALLTTMSNKKYKEYREMYAEMWAETGAKYTPVAFMEFVEWRKRVEALFKSYQVAAVNAGNI